MDETLVNGQLEISKATVEDAELIIEYLNKVGGQSDYLTFGLNAFPYSVEDEKELIDKCLETELCLMLVAKRKDQIVGQLFLDRSDNPRLIHVGELGLTVEKDFWGKGIGTRLLANAIKWAQDKQLGKLQLQVRTDHAKAIALYQKFKFVIEGKVSRAVKIGNCYFDNFVMGLEL